MSMGPLLIAVRDHLRTKFVLDSKNIGIQPDGQPPPFVGDLYLAVYPRGSSLAPGIGEIMSGVAESFSIGVCISQKITKAPRDRVADEIYVKAVSGVTVLADKVRAYVHQIWTSNISGANALLVGTDQIVEWFRWEGTSAPRLVGPEWFWTDEEAAVQPVGLAVDVLFRDACRYQAYSRVDYS